MPTTLGFFSYIDTITSTEIRKTIRTFLLTIPTYSCGDGTIEK